MGKDGKLEASAERNGKAPSVHFSLQGKGGVGKSFVAALLAQYFRERSGGKICCVDSDPVNATLAGYESLGAEHLNVMRRGQIQERQFDALIEKICAFDGVMVVDTGATNFIPMWHYMLENEILRLLRDHGRNAFVHSVVVGGQGLRDTLSGLDEVAGTADGRRVVVWLNEYFGEIESEGKKFEDMAVYARHRDKIAGAVMIPQHNPQTWGEDVREMLERRMTFQQVVESPHFNLVAKQRLQILRREIFEQLDLIDMK
jgi:hypothetical protein